MYRTPEIYTIIKCQSKKLKLTIKKEKQKTQGVLIFHKEK